MQKKFRKKKNEQFYICPLAVSTSTQLITPNRRTSLSDRYTKANQLLLLQILRKTGLNVTLG